MRFTLNLFNTDLSYDMLLFYDTFFSAVFSYSMIILVCYPAIDWDLQSPVINRAIFSL